MKQFATTDVNNEKCTSFMLKTLTVEVDGKSYSVVVPSSLYKFGHNTAEPYDNAGIHEWR